MNSPSNPSEQSTAEDLVSRRHVLKVGAGLLAGCYLAGAVYPVWRYLEIERQESDASSGNVREVTLRAADMPNEGEAVFFQFGDEPAILTRRRGGALVCLSAVCTHKGCTVKYDPAIDEIVCPCHKGKFNPDNGANLSGPPKSPLPTFNVEVLADAVVVRRRSATA